jgi:hypothetical protein
MRYQRPLSFATLPPKASFHRKKEPDLFLQLIEKE